MADETTAFVIPLHQAPPKKKAKTGDGRAKASRPRKRQKAKGVTSPDDAESASSELLISPEFLSADLETAEPPVTEPVTQSPTVTSHSAERHSAERELAERDLAERRLVERRLAERLAEPDIASRRQIASILLSAAALALAVVGITINGWFARSLGSSDIAGWLFLAVGVAADLVALVMPSCASGLWQAGQRATALVGWAVWLMTFVFAVTAGIGFASTNINDVTLARASRVTPTVASAQAALTDAMAARDRECKSGVGKFCREREAAVAERRQILDTAVASVEETADPQTGAAIKLVAWVSGGMLRPTADDFAMLRLVLLALLPQIGGILLMVGRSRT